MNMGTACFFLEEHNEIGRPFQCAGLVNPAAMETIGLENSILSTIWGVKYPQPIWKNGYYRRSKKCPEPYSVCRKIFDEVVVMQSIATGTEIMLSTKPVSANIESDYVEVKIDGVKWRRYNSM